MSQEASELLFNIDPYGENEYKIFLATAIMIEPKLHITGYCMVPCKAVVYVNRKTREELNRKTKCLA